jgi:hypothetical protein
MPRLPRFDRGNLGLVAGVLVGLGFAAYVVVGVVHGAQGSSDTVTNADASTSASPTPTVSASVVPGPGSSSGKPDKSGSGNDKPKKHFTLSNVGGPSLAELTQAVEQLLKADPTKPPAQFTVSSLNVLGASHTGGGGNKPGYASGPQRIVWALQLLRAYGVDVVGLQESESTQIAAFNRLTGSAFDVYPGTSMGRGPVRQSIAWRTDTWKLVSAHTISIPYFHGHRIPMPYVLLQNRDSGQGVYFFNVHNPATTKSHGNNQYWRNVAENIEAQLVRRLRATGVPVVFTGDFNERVSAFCRMTSAGLHAANGGSSGGHCIPPGDSGIDWIFGSSQIQFSDYVRQRDALVRRATDHPIVVAHAQVNRGG